MRTELEVSPGRTIQFVNLHMGTSFFERRKQVHKILAGHVLERPHVAGGRIIVGDFNEWTHGLASKMLSARMSSADVKAYLKRGKTYPGFLPFLHLDHVYFDPPLKLQCLSVVRNRTSLIASDHLPLVADFVFNGERGQS